MGLLDGLVSYWKLDEASGTRLDSWGSNHLADGGGTSSTTGKINSCTLFNSGSNSFLNQDSNTSLQTGDIDFTIAFWAKSTSLPFFNTPISKDTGNGTLAREYGFYYSGGTLYFYVSSNGQNSGVVQVGSSFSLSSWRFVVGCHDSVNNQIKISIDNGAFSTVSHSGGVFAANSRFRVSGTDNGPSSTSIPWNGEIDEIGFWKRVLSSDERTQLYNSGSGLAFENFGPTTVTSSFFPYFLMRRGKSVYRR